MGHGIRQGNGIRAGIGAIAALTIVLGSGCASNRPATEASVTAGGDAGAERVPAQDGRWRQGQYADMEYQGSVHFKSWYSVDVRECGVTGLVFYSQDGNVDIDQVRVDYSDRRNDNGFFDADRIHNQSFRVQRENHSSFLDLPGNQRCISKIWLKGSGDRDRDGSTVDVLVARQGRRYGGGPRGGGGTGWRRGEYANMEYQGSVQFKSWFPVDVRECGVSGLVLYSRDGNVDIDQVRVDYEGTRRDDGFYNAERLRIDRARIQREGFSTFIDLPGYERCVKKVWVKGSGERDRDGSIVDVLAYRQGRRFGGGGGGGYNPDPRPGYPGGGRPPVVLPGGRSGRPPGGDGPPNQVLQVLTVPAGQFTGNGQYVAIASQNIGPGYESLIFQTQNGDRINGKITVRCGGRDFQNEYLRDTTFQGRPAAEWYTRCNPSDSMNLDIYLSSPRLGRGDRNPLTVYGRR